MKSSLPIGQRNNQQDDPYKSASKQKTSFMGISLQSWAITAISAIAVISAAGKAAVSLYQYMQEHKKIDIALTKQNTQLEAQLAPVANETKIKMSEADKHAASHEKAKEIPIESTVGEVVSAKYYPSDGCIRLSRTHGSRGAYGISDSQDMWIPDPSRASLSSLSGPDDDVLHRTLTASINHAFSELSAPSQLPISSSPSAAADLQHRNKQARLKTAGYQGSCLNPHPWNFTVQNVQIDACLVQVWRRFADGCTHNQMYNACNGQWDPNINWNFCAFQHHP